MRLTVTVNEAARILGCSARLVYDQIEEGKIACLKIGRRRLIPRIEIERIVGMAIDWSEFV